MGTRVNRLCPAAAALLSLLCGCAALDGSLELPDSPAQAWEPADTNEYSVLSYPAPAEDDRPALDPDHVYSLSGLIDLALQCNPATRQAWLEARQAQTAVHAAESAFYPRLDAVLAAGHEHIPLPLPEVVFPDGYFYTDIHYGRPEIQFNWVLLDFGRRSAVVEGAKHLTAAAGFSFNAALQDIGFRVSETYYRACVADRYRQVMQATHKESAMMLSRAESAREQGLATRLELLEARHQHARASFDAAAAATAARQARLDLTAAVGIAPTPDIRIERLSENPPLEPLEDDIQRLLDEALANRPQLRGIVAELRMAEAGIREAEAAYLPQLVVTGNGGPFYNGFNVEDSDRISTFEMEYGASVALSFNLFDGGLSRHRLDQAQQLRESLENELILQKNRVVQEVWTAYNSCRTAREKRASAETLLETAQNVYDDAVQSQARGLATMLEVLQAHQALHEARLLKTSVDAEIAITAIGLKRATGILDL